MGKTTGISFVNATTGFAAAFDGAGNRLLFTVTHDAGHTWQSVALTPPGDFGGLGDVQPPVFTSATNGVFAVTYSSQTNQKRLSIYRTADAGTHWTLGPVLTVSSQSTAATVAPSSVTVSGEVFAATIGNVALYGLLPGASSWTPINSTSGLLAGLTKLDFVDGSNGWAVTQSGLIETTDGGVTWTPLHT